MPGDRLLSQTVRATGRSAALLLAAALVEAGTRLAMPATLGLAVDATLGGTSSRLPLFAVAALILLTTAGEMLRAAADARARARGTLFLRRKLLRHLFAVGIPARSRFGGADLVTRLLESSTEAAAVTSVLVTLVTSLLTSVGAVVALFIIDVWVGLLFVAGALVVWWLTRWLIGRMAATTRSYQAAHGELAERFANALGGARTIRAAGTVDWEINRVLRPLERLRLAGTDFWDTQRRAGWQLGLLVPVLQVIALAVAGWGVGSGRLSPGSLLAIAGYLGYAMGLLSQVAALGRLARAKGSAQRVQEVLAMSPPEAGTAELPPGDGELRLTGIRVSAGGSEVLRGFDLTVPGGASVAIVGASGAGKSTLAAVAGGLLPPDQGTVRLDGIPLGDLRPAALRAAFGYGFERPVLLGETIADAVSYADRPEDAARVATALRDGAAAGFVARLPEGARTRIDALRLSGGEMQRLGLARALCRDVRVLVLDDATSSVDTATEAEITDVLERARNRCTTLLVAHRMSVAARADLVAWLADGRLRALAPHRELMADDAYRALFRAEAAETPVTQGGTRC